MTVTLTTDAVCFDDDQSLLLVRRRNEPFKGLLALPGGKVETGETAEAACLRELREETGLVGEWQTLVGVYSEPSRDPRGRWVTVAYLVSPRGIATRSGSDASSVEWIKNWREVRLAFDHSVIARDALATLHRRNDVLAKKMK